jgi:hypothetical protein
MKHWETNMSNWSIWATGRTTILFLVFALAIDIGGAGTMLAAGVAKAHGQKIDVLAGP